MRHRFKQKMCFMCGTTQNIEKHHIFSGVDRDKSDRDGLTVYLCRDCHRDKPWAAHQSGKTAQLLHAYGQMQWMRQHKGSTIDDFRQRYGKNYLRDYKE